MAGTLIMSSGVVLMTTATTAQAASGKVFVCKYVGTPGDGERLQTGNNPISVSTNALGNAPDGSSFNGTLPFWFSDAHGRSVAFKYDERQGGGQQGEPPLSECPTPPAPPTDKEIDPPGKPGTDDACGPGNIRFVGYSDGEGYAWTLGDDGSVTATPKPGFKFEGGSQSVTYYLPADSNVACPKDDVKVDPPVEPGTDDACGPGNIRFVGYSDGEGYAWTLGDDGSLTATPKPGFKFHGASQSVTYQLPADSNEACPKEEEPERVAAALYDTTGPTCDVPGALVVKSQPTGVTATQSPAGTGPGTYAITFTAGDGFELAGPDSQSVTVLPQLTGTACDDVGGGGIAAPQPAVQQPPVTEQPPAVVGGVEQSKPPKAAKPKPVQAPAAAGPKAAAGPQAAPDPAIAGVQAAPAVPTAVSAGLGSLPTAGPMPHEPLGRTLAAGGLALLVAAGWLAMGRREAKAVRA